MATPQTIKIDGIHYATSELNDEAKGQLMNLRVTDQEIARLQTQLAITQTARAAYAQALNVALPKAEADKLEVKKPAAKKVTTKKG